MKENKKKKIYEHHPKLGRGQDYQEDQEDYDCENKCSLKNPCSEAPGGSCWARKFLSYTHLDEHMETDHSKQTQK